MRIFKPFIEASQKIPEMGFLPLFIGSVLGIIFGASSLYLALKVGMTVSASIPVAVLSITLFKYFSKWFGVRNANILENNMVQTTGSAGESIAFGVAVTMPALFILGFEMELSRILIVSVLGGFLGILMMIPLRKSLIVNEHGKLTYPEGTACAEVLIAGEKGGMSAVTVFSGFFIGLFYKIANAGMKLWPEIIEKPLTWLKGGILSCEVAPELLGVGYIIGPRIGGITIAGGILSSMVLIPVIKFFGDGLLQPLFPGTILISQMSTHDIWRNYVLYIGAGAVTTGGIISLLENFPIIVRSVIEGMGTFSHKGNLNNGQQNLLRTEQDLPFKYVFLGVLALIITIALIPSLKMNLIGAILIIVFGFLFVNVSSRLTGEIGSSSNPISGMTVATLLLTSLVYLAFGWVDLESRVSALSVAAIVCIAASNGGTTSQDLKTGFLLGATPRLQQIGILVGTLTSALVIGLSLKYLNEASTIYSRNIIPAGLQYQGNLEALETETRNDPLNSQSVQTYKVYWHKRGDFENLNKVPEGKYYLDSVGHFQYFVDPGINGLLSKRDDGSSVPKYEAPKAQLMSLIIDGILSQKLPWTLVLLGAFIAITVHLCGLSILPFAVGVYLPLSSSMPLFVGGAVRYILEKYFTAKKHSSQKAESTESEDSPGVLYSSGLIAGGSIAGVLMAFISVSPSFMDLLNGYGAWSFLSNNIWVALVAFTGLCFSLLYAAKTSKNQP